LFEAVSVFSFVEPRVAVGCGISMCFEVLDLVIQFGVSHFTFQIVALFSCHYEEKGREESSACEALIDC
jgi:hypothetical protein